MFGDIVFGSTRDRSAAIPTPHRQEPARAIIPQDLVKELGLMIEKPNLVALSYALRHPELWPKDFYWNYGDCSTCAIGLSLRLWPSIGPFKEVYDNPLRNVQIKTTCMAREMAISYRKAEELFFNLNGAVDQDLRQRICPDDVADAIDNYLKVA